MSSPSVKSFTDRSKAILLLWIICVIYVSCLSCFRVCSLLPLVTCWEGLTSRPLFVMFIYFVTFPCCILGQVLYLIVSFPDLCHLSYFGMAAFSRKRPFVTNSIIETR